MRPTHDIARLQFDCLVHAQSLEDVLQSFSNIRKPHGCKVHREYWRRILAIVASRVSPHDPTARAFCSSKRSLVKPRWMNQFDEPHEPTLLAWNRFGYTQSIRYFG
jgi:hypothetical protein